jgi:hypothetical protein
MLQDKKSTLWKELVRLTAPSETDQDLAKTAFLIRERNLVWAKMSILRR